ncbi:MAG: hypothetical protein QY332_02285 [Anaerolineales bacterium]|nr:MAG: hypothetical protein QY332_02285 [Anaerolineales bacterium]
MKHACKFSCQALFLLLILSLAFLADSRPVAARTDPPKGPSPLFVGLMTPDIPSEICMGQKLTIEFYFVYLRGSKAPPLVPRMNEAEARLSSKVGTVSPKLFRYTNAKVGGSVNIEKFSYATGKKEGNETINITVSMFGEKVDLKPPITFKVKKCSASMKFHQRTSFSYMMASVITTYSGSGTLKMDENGGISGSGTQAIWSDIPPYSLDGGSCVHSPPWEGSSGITFSGQMDDDGAAVVSMELAALSVNSTTLTCTGEDHSASMSFPGYTYGACQIVLDDFSFESGTLDVPFNCPGEEPYTVPITIIPRRGS